MRSRYLFISALLSSAALFPHLAVAQGTPEEEEAAESSPQLEELLVQGQFIPEPKRETPQVASFLDAEALARAGDSTAALALRRVTGLSLVRDRFIYVRGLGERYANVTLNGSTLPSPEPLRRVAPLDIFPAAVLGGASVQKTYSVNLPGEFGGGVVQLDTPTTPAEPFFKIGVDASYNSQTTFRNGLHYDGSGTDFLGFDDGLRDIPEPLADAMATGKRVSQSNFSDTELQNIGRSLENSKLWVLFDGDVSPSGSVDVSGGDSFFIGDLEVGLVGSAGYSSDWSTKRGERDTATIGSDSDGNDTLLRRNDLDLLATENEIRWHGLGNIGLTYGDHDVRLTGLYLKTTSKEARSIAGFSAREGTNIRQDFLEWIDREMGSIQMAGNHYFGEGLLIDWNASYSESSRDAPYDRNVRYVEDNNGNLIYDDRQGRNQTRFSTVTDEVWGLQGRISYDILLTNTITATPYVGYQRNETKREARQRDFRLLERGAGLPQELLGQRIDYIFADQNINPNRLVLIETTGATADPAYNGELDFEGYFGGMELALGDTLRIDAGVRREDSTLMVDTFDFFNANEEVETHTDEGRTLPAATVTWTFYENMQLRGGFSETLSRPQFRELAFSQFINVDTDQNFVGNPYLVTSDIQNYDLRWEWYFGENEFFTAGLFYKKIENPIEETINASGDIRMTSFQNAPRADLRGVEIEFTKYFEFDGGFLGMDDFLSTKEFLVSTNYTFTDSELKVKEGDTVIRPNGTVLNANRVIDDGRSLQGQSDHVVNLELGFADFEARSQATILVNWVSKRIRELGVQTLPPVYVEEPIMVDFRYSRMFEKWDQDFQFTFTVRNILGGEHKATQSLNGNVVNVDTYELGRSVSLGLSATF